MTANRRQNETVTFRMFDGETEMTLQMFALYQLKAKRSKEWSWDRYNKISQGKGDEGEMDIAYLLYTAHLCACVARGEEPGTRYDSFEAFLMNLPADRIAMRDAYEVMTGQKKA